VIGAATRKASKKLLGMESLSFMLDDDGGVLAYR
jgi:hypothetical protein